MDLDTATKIVEGTIDNYFTCQVVFTDDRKFIYMALVHDVILDLGIDGFYVPKEWFLKDGGKVIQWDHHPSLAQQRLKGDPLQWNKEVFQA